MRTWRDEDLAALVALNADAEVMRFLGGVNASTADAEAMLGRLTAHWQTHGFGVWAVERRDANAESGAFIGFAGIAVPRWEAANITPCVEIMWRFAPAAWGRGLATEAASAALDDGFAQHAFAEVLSFTVQPNARSWRVMERLGMRRSPADDFDHPFVANGDPLRRHVVYRITREAHAASRTKSR